MRYLPHTAEDIDQMLDVIGVKSIEALFECIPPDLRLQKELPIPAPFAELELREELRRMSRRNAHGNEWINFLGAGAYRHYVPSAVKTLVSRSEFATAYTPYQPEVSQGTLQALYEFQTMVAELCGLEIANASNYDGASAVAEAILTAMRITKRRRILISQTLPPEYRQVIKTYLRYSDVIIVEVPFDPESGRIDRSIFNEALGNDVCCVVVGYPNFFGVLETFEDIAEKTHEAGALFITSTAEPWALALAKSPGELGADIATAEGQSFGNAIQYGGPSLGLFATHKKFARQIPGRLIGETVDCNGERGYVLTLATREQHIRRERATSNICTNVSLCALAATITLSLLGPRGFRHIASDNLKKSELAKQQLGQIPGVSLPFTGATFNEFIIKVPGDPEVVLAALRDEGILGGVSIKEWYHELENHLLVSVTEMNTDEEISTFSRKLGNALAED